MTKPLGVWDLLLIGLLVSPLVSGLLFLNTMNTILTVEVVPADQATVPIPDVGDSVEVYGTWVRDQHIFGADYLERDTPGGIRQKQPDGSGRRNCRVQNA